MKSFRDKSRCRQTKNILFCKVFVDKISQMDNSSLNVAHYHCRRAENHLRKCRFDEAIESHQKAANALSDTLQACANNAKISDSIKLQRDFQMKNIELVRLKKVQYEKYKAAIEQQRQKNSSFLEQRAVKDRTGNVCDLQISIFKTLEESDSLLDLLSGKRTVARKSVDNDSNALADGTDASAENTNATKPKNTKSDSSIVDDMHSLNHQLHILVFNLVTRIDESSHELEVLRDRIKLLEKNENQCQRRPSVNKSLSESSNKTDEEHEHENQRISLSGEERTIVLPESSELPPLELPEFDYNF